MEAADEPPAEAQTSGYSLNESLSMLVVDDSTTSVPPNDYQVGDQKRASDRSFSL